MEAAGLTPLGPEALDMDRQTFVALLRTSWPSRRAAGSGAVPPGREHDADESLWAAVSIPPARPSLTASEARPCCVRSRSPATSEYARGGRDLPSDFPQCAWRDGPVRDRLRVYDRRGQPRPCAERRSSVWWSPVEAPMSVQLRGIGHVRDEASDFTRFRAGGGTDLLA